VCVNYMNYCSFVCVNYMNYVWVWIVCTVIKNWLRYCCLQNSIIRYWFENEDFGYGRVRAESIST